MITKEQVILNDRSTRFNYLQREDNKKVKKVDLVYLNANLNRNKKLNFYNNAKIIAFCLSFITIIVLISWKY